MSWIEMESRVNLAVDESAIAKSAAWAWLQQGSSSNGQPIREFEVWRKKFKSKPSRYKLEALQNVQKMTSKSPSILLNSPRPSNKSLFDSYEIERISRQLDYYIESSHAKHHGRDSDVVAADVTEKNKVVRKKKIAKGFRLKHIPACGSSSDDVVESRRFQFSRKPEKGSVACLGRGAASVHNQGGRF